MSDAYTQQFAIQCPDGTLWRQSDHSFMFMFGVEAEQPPTVFNTRAEADYVLAKIRQAAAGIGVNEWAGVIVTRYCTPFTVVDPAEHLVGELEAWMQARGRHGR